MDPQVGLDASGGGVAVWSRSNGTNDIVQAAVRPAGGSWEPGVNVSPPGENNYSPQLAVAPDGSAVVVWQRSGTRTSIHAAVRPPGGPWQPAQELSTPDVGAQFPQVSVDSAGNAIAVWTESDGMNNIVQARFRPAGGAWQAAQALSLPPLDANLPQVAFGAGGDAVAVWELYNGTNSIVQAAVRPAGGPWQLPTQDLSAIGQNAYGPQVGLDQAGNAVAVWTRSDVTNNIVQAAVRPPGGPWQLPAQDLSASGQTAYVPQLAVDPAGDAIAVWYRSGGNIVQAAVRPAGGPWQGAQDISTAGQPAVNPQVAFDGLGSAVAVWGRSNGSNQIVQASLRPPAGNWQPAQDLSALGQNAYDPQVAFDPAGNALTVWERSNGTNTIVQAAPYDAAGPVLRSIKTPANGFARQRLTFSVDPLDVWSALAGPPVWTFGDGKSASGLRVTHTYARRGTFTVGLSAQDALGNVGTATRLLTLRTARCFGSAATRVGSNGKDTIVGTRGADVIVTLGGSDRVRGRGGNDRICGGPGRDRLFGGAGNDRLNGGPGRDTCTQGAGRGRLVSC